MKATEKSQPVIFEDIENRIIDLRGEKVLLDCDVAVLYGVATKEINQAVRNNAEKFPEGYIMALNKTEKMEVVKNFDHLDNLKFSSSLPKAFTEKGLYMLATILKSERATQTPNLFECLPRRELSVAKVRARREEWNLFQFPSRRRTSLKIMQRRCLASTMLRRSRTSSTSKIQCFLKVSSLF